MARTATSWQAVRDEVLGRIRSGAWAPGAQIPHEADLAAELGCARATVNRALQAVADTGLIERRRRAGTRVAVTPARRATLDIPLIRHEVEALGQVHGFDVLHREILRPPSPVRARLGCPASTHCLHVEGLHRADGEPYVWEDRWIDLTIAPEARDAPFAQISPNEWLVRNVPFEGGDIAFAAEPAQAAEARALGCATGTPVFVLDRLTRRGTRGITQVRMVFAPGYRLTTRI
jgi:GntR family histidine utilization transcriptional repressor